MGRTEKNRGRNFEYWVADRLSSLGMNASRNPLSGASVQISKEMGRNDVRAFYRDLKMFVECKKTSKSQITLHKDWFDKLKPVLIEHSGITVEPLVFAFQPSPGKMLEPVACLPLDDFCRLLTQITDLRLITKDPLS